jgi:putative endonuclease
MDYYIYIMASKKNGVLYVGKVDNLIKRIYEHKNNFVKGFTGRYKVYKLVYFEHVPDLYSAYLREKQLKKWRRSWKVELIEKNNSEWKDLYPELLG